MRKVLSFSLFLMLGLVISQLLPGALGAGYASFKACSDTLLYVCLGFIMINVGREFEIDKSRWRSYTADYFIAMATAALPWILIVLYYIFVLLPPPLWGSGEAWKENLLLSRFAAPTSAGILFTMLAALSLKQSWIYKKIQVLAIFDDLDTILLMIPLQILMIGLRWQMFAIIAIVVVLLAAGWRWQARWNVRQDWKTILGLAVVVCALTQAVYIATAKLYGPENSIHIEVLLPAFVVGMLKFVADQAAVLGVKAVVTVDVLFLHAGQGLHLGVAVLGVLVGHKLDLRLQCQRHWLSLNGGLASAAATSAAFSRSPSL